MALSTRIKAVVNRLLARVNLRLDSLTADRAEQERLRELAESGALDSPRFSAPTHVCSTYAEALMQVCSDHAQDIARLRSTANNDVGFSLHNDYYPSPDADILYALLRMENPGRYLEIGAGNSTRVARQAVRDGELTTHIHSIDPEPRVDVIAYADRLDRARVETMLDADVFDLRAGDVLFIDSSHEIRSGNDVVHLYLDVLPRLAPGVLVHIHDVFLPYDYPTDWVLSERWSWNEQYLLQAILGSDAFEVVWPGYHLQRTRPDFRAHFPHMRDTDRAQSYWIRRR